MMGQEQPCKPTGKTIEFAWCAFQEYLFPTIDGRPRSPGGTLPVVHHRARVASPPGTTSCPVFAPCASRPQQDRVALARAFIAKAVFDSRSRLPAALLERLAQRPAALSAACAAGRVCGRCPARLTQQFSRAFAAGKRQTRLRAPWRAVWHEALIENTMQEQLERVMCRRDAKAATLAAMGARSGDCEMPKQPELSRNGKLRGRAHARAR